MEAHRLRELVYAKTVDGLDCFDVAAKWGFKSVALLLQVPHHMSYMRGIEECACSATTTNVPLLQEFSPPIDV
jgi:hypothetical protein